MERKTIESTAANYPYLRGLWTFPMGIMLMISGISNLEHGPTGARLLAIFVGGLALAGAAAGIIARYYRTTYGTVTPTRSRQVRYGVAVAVWIVVLFVGASHFLFWSADSTICVYAAAFALATLVYYAILVGLRVHHVVIWGVMFVAGILPIWGDLGTNRDAVALFPLGLALILSGIFDQRALACSFEPSQNVQHAQRHVGA